MEINGTAIKAASAVSVLDLGWRKLHRVRLAVRGEPIDDGPSGVSEAQEFGDFVEGFSGGVVARVAYVLVGPGVAVLAGQVKMRVPSGDYQRHDAESKFVVAFLALFKQDRVDVSFEMVHRDQRLLKGEG